MARQAGDIKITGSMEDLCFYKMQGAYYVRMKSSLTGKRFWKEAVFEGSRKSCGRFGEGNRLASLVYKMVARENKQYALFCLLKSKAIFYLKLGLCGAGVIAALEAYLPGRVNRKTKKLKKETRPRARHVRAKNAPRVFVLPGPGEVRKRRCRRYTPV